jgi:hypothetical protein
MNSNNGSSLEAKLSKAGIALTITGMGHIISFKNKKRGGIGRRKDGTTFAMAWTPRNVKEWMEQVIQHLESQLHGLFPIREGETVGECRKRLLTAQSLPLDDSLDWMITGQQSVKVVPKGQEGAIIVIEKI